MTDFALRITEPLKSVKHLSEMLTFWNEEVCLKRHQGSAFIYSIVLGTEGNDEGFNVIWLKESKTPPVAPVKAKDYSLSLNVGERRKAIAKLENEEKLELRSSAIVKFSTGRRWVAYFDPATPAPQPVPMGPASPGLSFDKTLARVSNRGRPGVAFLRELVTWGKMAPAEIFEDRTTEERDIYASVEQELGPYLNDAHRKACLLEVMRVLAGFESSWDWTEGRDTKNTPANSPQNEIEAGAWQVSSNSINFGKDLKDLVLAHVQSTDAVAFQAAMKTDHPLAMEYTARLLRHTIRHHGPVKRSEIDEWLSKDAVEEFQQLLRA
jgi:hypothetical protein